MWYAFFRQEFEFPDFLKGYHCAFAVEDNNEIIVAGGIRPIAEVVAITNRNASPKQKVMALRKLLEAGKFGCKVNGYDQLHCFVQDDNWARQLQTVHFRPTVGKPLVLDV